MMMVLTKTPTELLLAVKKLTALIELDAAGSY
jgi:hypothetical protein